VKKYFTIHINFLLDFSTFALAQATALTFYLTIAYPLWRWSALLRDDINNGG